MLAAPAIPESDVVLRDGTILHVRQGGTADEGILLALLRSLSNRSRWLRFFSEATDLAGSAHALASDPRALSVLAFAGTGACVAHACYIRGSADRAEIAFAVADAYQGRGVATLLLGILAEAAAAQGIVSFEAWTMADNLEMLKVFRESGFPITTRSHEGGVMIDMPTSFTAAALAMFDLRDQVATIASLRPLLHPRSIAVVGAGRERGSIGGELFHNLVATGFNGPVYPVNASVTVVQSVPAYRSVADIPGDVDLAVLVVPARHVIGVARECAAKGVRAIVVISAGFAETGAEGAALQHELLTICRDAGIRLVGPNCMGILNTAADVRMDATFAPTYPPAGRVGFLSQSGALGIAVIDEATERGLGLSTFVSVGNKADLSANDLLQYWEKDPATDVVLLYLESFGNPRRFGRISRRVARTKPVIAVKSGRSIAGARATSSHTGALVAASDLTVDALFAQAGVIRTTTLKEMFDVATVLATQPTPAGRRVAILSNAGGPAILCADACAVAGLEVAGLPADTQAALREFLPAEASTDNPVDMIASASAANYARALRVLAACGTVDAIIVIFIPPLVTARAEVAASLAAAARDLPRQVPILSVFMSASGALAGTNADGARIPTYRYPEDAAVALGHAVRYGLWRARPESTVRAFTDVRRADAQAILDRALERGHGWLAPDEVGALCACYGLPLAPQRLVASPEAAEAAARSLGGRVALKAVAPRIVHKTEAGGVRLGLDAAAVRGAAEEMRTRIPGDALRFLVQAMVPRGVEMIVGVVHDTLFGPVVACGAGGTTVELLKDVNVRITPLTERDASEMVRTLRTFPLLDGYRGAPRADNAALEDVILRVAALVDAHPEIAELDLNPVVVLEHGAVIVDARVSVDAPVPPPLVIGRARTAPPSDQPRGPRP
jgi:acetyl coenzyme A synthetase (ADP forming)-like protein